MGGLRAEDALAFSVEIVAVLVAYKMTEKAFLGLATARGWQKK